MISATSNLFISCFLSLESSSLNPPSWFFTWIIPAYFSGLNNAFSDLLVMTLLPEPFVLTSQIAIITLHFKSLLLNWASFKASAVPYLSLYENLECGIGFIHIFHLFYEESALLWILSFHLQKLKCCLIFSAVEFISSLSQGPSAPTGYGSCTESVP